MAKFSGASCQQLLAPRGQLHRVSIKDLGEWMWWWPLTRGNHTHRVIAAEKSVQRVAVLTHEPGKDHAQQLSRVRVILLATRLIELQPIPQDRWLGVKADWQDLRASSAQGVLVLAAVAAQLVTQSTPTTADRTDIATVVWRRHEFGRQPIRAGD